MKKISFLAPIILLMFSSNISYSQKDVGYMSECSYYYCNIIFEELLYVINNDSIKIDKLNEIKLKTNFIVDGNSCSFNSIRFKNIGAILDTNEIKCLMGRLYKIKIDLLCHEDHDLYNYSFKQLYPDGKMQLYGNFYGWMQEKQRRY